MKVANFCFKLLLMQTQHFIVKKSQEMQCGLNHDI